jgi:Uma2 family endonuclease
MMDDGCPTAGGVSMSIAILPDEPEVRDPDIVAAESIVVHGWRTVRRNMFGGGTEVFQIPLMAWDVLHPQLGDEVLYTDAHQAICNYLRSVFEYRVEKIPTTVVLNDTGVNLDLEGVKTISPDVCVIPNVRVRRNWTTFYVRKERTKPSLGVEVTSQDRRENDTERKFDYYHRAGIPVYVIVDLVKADANGIPPLLGFEWAPENYKPMKPDSRGRLWLEAVGVWIEARPNSVVCCDGDTGEEIKNFAGQVNARREAEQRAQAEAFARLVAEDRIKQLEAELAKVRGDKQP